MSIYKRYGIYGIRNKLNGMIYVGKTVNNFGDRWDCHKASIKGGYCANPNLGSEINKYGVDNFEYIILDDCTGKDLEYVNQREIEEIKKYKELGLAYNIANGGDIGALKGHHLSEETKRKIGEKNRVNMTGRKASEKTKKKMSESQKARYSKWTDEERQEWSERMSVWLKGHKCSEETRKKMIGNKNGATYTIEQVKEIRRLNEEEGKSYTEIAQIVGIPRGTVYGIATYRRWKDV